MVFHLRFFKKVKSLHMRVSFTLFMSRVLGNPLTKFYWEILTKFSIKLTSDLKLPLADNSLVDSRTLEISVTIFGLGFFLIGFGELRSASVMESSLFDSIVFSVSFPRDFFFNSSSMVLVTFAVSF